MQQHTGQHILSAAFDRLFGVRTVSFHLGSETSTIDLAREVTHAELAAAEEAANRVVWDDRPVTVRFATADRRSSFRFARSHPGPASCGSLMSPHSICPRAAAHVRTGMIGVIAVSGWERFKGEPRRVCGAVSGHSDPRAPSRSDVWRGLAGVGGARGSRPQSNDLRPRTRSLQSRPPP
jgi:alanyl-tRNA synthetase